MLLDERSILDDEALRDRYAEEIPVLLIDDEVHNYWRIDPVRLKTALLASDPSRSDGSFVAATRPPPGVIVMGASLWQREVQPSGVTGV